MKRRNNILVFSGILLIVLAVFIIRFISFPCNDPASLKKYIAKYGERIEALFADAAASHDSFDTESSPVARELYRKCPSLRRIGINENKWLSLSFRWTYSGEKSTQLQFCPHGTEDLKEQWNFDQWEIETNTEDKILLTGGGIDGSGYVKITRILEKWYLVESYLPT